MRRSLEVIYEAADNDNWSGDLIREESAKLHNTIQHLADQLTAILLDPCARDEDKDWAKEQLEKVLN